MKYTVATYTDLNGAKLSDRGKEHVINQLEDNDAILWLEDWLREDKGLETLAGTKGLYAVTVERETEKAWYLSQESGNAEWVPKSCSELYVADSQGVDKETPQLGLEDY